MHRRHWFQLATGSVVAITVTGCGDEAGGHRSAEAEAAEDWLAGLTEGRLSGGVDARDLRCGAPVEQRHRVAEFLSDQESAPFASLWAEGSSLEARDAEGRSRFAFKLKFFA